MFYSLDLFTKRVIVDGQVVDVEFCDTAGIEYQDRIRPLAFQNAVSPISYFTT